MTRRKIGRAAFAVLLVLLTLTSVEASICVNWRYEVKGSEVSYASKRLDGVDTASFRVLRDKTMLLFEMLGCARESYALDARSVFYRGERISDADAATFELLGWDFARDRARTYSEGAVIPLSANAIFVSERYATDGISGYHYFAKRLTGSPFSVLQRGYAKSDQAVYYRGEMVAGADPASFEVLKDGVVHARDAKSVFFAKTKIESADRDSFIVLDPDSFYAKDNSSVFFAAHRVPEADPFSFRVLHAKASPNHYGAYYQDRHAAYLEGRRMMYVDPVSNERALVDPQTFRFIAVGAPYETVVDRRYGYRISTAGGAGIEVTCKVDARTPAALPPCK